MSIEAFDIQAYLDDKKISYATEGKNVSSGWINVQCPFCSDQTNHLGISPSRKISCWICGIRGSVTKYIREIEQCSESYANTIIAKYQDRSLAYLDKKERTRNSKIILPKSAIVELPKLHQNYLIKRGFDPDYLSKKYDLLACSELGDYKWRIIVPIYYQNEMVTFTARDITGKAAQKYKNLPVEKSVMSTKEVLYNLDFANKVAVIVEGVFDAWRIGDGAVATIGTKYTKKQISHLIGFKKAFIMFDSDAKDWGLKLAEDMAAVVPSVEQIELSEGDPADLSEEDVKYLRKDIGL